MKTRLTEEEFRASYRTEKNKLRSIRYMLFYVVAVQSIVTVAAAFVSGFLPGKVPVYLEMLVIELLAYLLPLSLYAKENRLLTRREARERFGLRSFRRRYFLPILLAGFGCQFLMVLLNLPLQFVISEPTGQTAQNIWQLLAELVVLALVPAIFEEVLMRGIVYGVMADFNTAVALIFTSVMFALMHGSITGIPGYLCMGVLLVAVLRRTGSLYACMLFHFANNVTAVLLSYFSAWLMDEPEATLKLFLAGGIACIIGWAFLLLTTEKAAKVRRLKTGTFLGQSFVNLPVVLCVACVVAMWILERMI